MEHHKKKIGISFTHTSFQQYWDWFTPADLADTFELVQLSFEKNNVEELATCDGFVLTGGVDVHPSFYNAGAAYPNAPETFQPERARFEKKIYDYAQLHPLPLLAICRGLQLVNVLNGGKLIQDFGVDNATHKKETVDDKVHPVQIEKGSLLHEISGEESYETNSAHHQAIDPNFIGENLVVNCRSATDGLIEGMEWKENVGNGFFLGVQWHPERITGKEQHPLSQKIKERFLAEVRKTNRKKLAIINPATEEVITALNVDMKESIEKKQLRLQAGQKNGERFL